MSKLNPTRLDPRAGIALDEWASEGVTIERSTEHGEWAYILVIRHTPSDLRTDANILTAAIRRNPELDPRLLPSFLEVGIKCLHDAQQQAFRDVE